MIQRLLMIILILVVVLGGGYYAYQQLIPPPEEEAQGPVYATQTVSRGDISVGVDTSGSLNPSRGGGIQAPGYRGNMAASISSYIIDDLLVEEGDQVKQGQLLIKLAAPELKTKIETLEDQLNADRKELADLMNIPVEQVSRIDPSAGLTMRAPIDGRLVGLEVEEGDELKQGQSVGRVVDDSRFRLTAKLTPVEFEGVKTGDLAVLRFPQFDGTVQAEVVEVNPNPVPESSSQLNQPGRQDSGQEENYQFVYWVTVEGKNPGLIRPGMTTNVGIVKDSEVSPGEEVDSQSIRWLMYLSTVESYVQEERILSRSDGIATQVFVKDMEMVKEGDPIVSLSGEDTRKRIEEQLDKIREQEMDLRELQSQTGQLEVRSPMDGVVANLQVEVGRTVQPGEWFGSIYNTSDMEMWVEVDDVDVLLVQQDAPVEVTVDALPGQVFEGKVLRVSTMGRDNGGITRFGVSIQVKGNPELRPGMQAQAHIDAGSAEDVLLIPLEAIFEEDGKPKVEILQDDGTPKVVTVELGLMNDRVAEVKSGLVEGQEVITGSTADLLPSQRIQGNDTLLPESPENGDEENDQGTNSEDR